jgi:hypothetical protein
MVLKIGHCGMRIRITLKALKCGAGERWRSVGLIKGKPKKYLKYSMRKEASYEGSVMDWSHLAYKLLSETRC